MEITSYHVNNILKAYGKQLSLSRRGAKHKELSPMNRSESITISGEAKRKSVIEKVTADIVDRIVHSGPQNRMEKEAFQELQNEYGNELITEEVSNTELVFKVIDKDNGEELKTLSLEDSNVLKSRLEEITKGKVNTNML